MKYQDKKYKKVIAIIPAKGNSRRLKNKNILPIKNVPMFVYVVNKLKKAIFIDEVYVSSENKKMKDLCKKHKINFINRPKTLSKNSSEKQEVIVHAVKTLLKKKIIPKTVISVQPNSPEIKITDLKKALNFFNNILYVKAPIKELICVNSKNIQNPSFRILTLKAVFQKSLSTKLGVYRANYIDIHTLADYKAVKKRIEKS
jgi:CMP-N-acetylneuraminic acid synthetase